MSYILFNIILLTQGAAALNFPNIATIYGLEDMRPSDASSQSVVRALVLELVEGDTLEARIRQAGGGKTAGVPLADTLKRRAASLR